MQILVIDPDFGFFRSVKNTLRQLGDPTLAVINARDLDSALQAVHDHANPQAQVSSSASKSKPDVATDPTQLNQGSMEFIVTRASQELVQLLSHDAPTFLGLEIEKLKSLKLLWKSLVDIDDRVKFNQFVASSKNADLKHAEIRFRDIFQRPFLAKVTLDSKDVSSANLIKVSIKAEFDPSLKEEAVPQAKSTDPQFIDMVILNWNLIAHQPKTLLEQLKKKVQQHNSGLSDRQCVFIFSAHDQPDVDVRLILSLNSDIIFKPLDDLLFLQKFIVYLPEWNRGKALSFLYTAAVDFDVELAGEYNLAAVSESGFQVKSRQPLKLGQRVKIYSDAFMSAAPQGLFATGYHSKDANGWKVSSYTGFALTQAQIRMLRGLVGSKPDQVVSDQDRKAESKKTAPVIHGMEPDPESVVKKQILIIDLDRETSKTLKEVVEHQFPQFDVIAMDSLKQAIYTMAPELTEAGRAELKQAAGAKHRAWEMRPAFFPNQPLKLLFSVDGKFKKFSEIDEKKSVIFGFEAARVGEVEDFWGSQLQPIDRLSFQDFLGFTASGQMAIKKYRFLNKSGSSHLVEVSGKVLHSKDGSMIELLLTDRTELVRNDEVESDLQKVSVDKLRRIDAVLIDASFFSDLPDESLKLMRQALHKSTGRSDQALLLLGPEMKVEKLADLAKLAVDDYVCKPIDRGHLVRRLRAFLQSGKKDLDQLERSEGFIGREGWVDFARPLKAEGIGEYGLQFVFSVQLPIGSWGHFYHPQLLDSQGRGVLARCYQVEAFEAAGKPAFRCHFMFIGVREERMQQIRLFVKRFAIAAEEAKSAS